MAHQTLSGRGCHRGMPINLVSLRGDATVGGNHRMLYPLGRLSVQETHRAVLWKERRRWAEVRGQMMPRLCCLRWCLRTRTCTSSSSLTHLSAYTTLFYHESLCRHPRILHCDVYTLGLIEDLTPKSLTRLESICHAVAW